MSEDTKGFKKKIFSKLTEEDVLGSITKGLAKDMINSVMSKAGKSKDELIEILGKEIGIALAAMLKDPLQQIVDSKKIKITIELLDKDPSKEKSKKKN